MVDKIHTVGSLMYYTIEWNTKSDKTGMVHPMHAAARFHSAEVIRFLGEWIGDWECRDEEGETPMHYAARYGNHRAIYGLAKLRADIDALNNQGETPLHLAVVREDPALVDLFFTLGSRAFTIQDHNGFTPLMRLILTQPAWNEDMFAVLYRWGPGAIDMVDHIGWTALHHAIDRRFSDAPGAFCDVNSNAFGTKSQFGYTPMHIAVFQRSKDCIRELRNSNSDLDAQSKAGMTPMHIAASLSTNVGVSLVKCLLKLGSRAYWMPSCNDRYPRDLMSAEYAAKTDALVPRMTMLEMVRMAADVHSHVAVHRRLE